MKPMTTMHLRFIAKKPHKAESRECLYDCRGITRDDAIRRHAFRHHRASSNDGRTTSSQGKGTACLIRNMSAQTECVRLFRFHEAKHLRGFAIKPLAKIDIRRDRMRPPITFYSAVRADVAHVLNFPEA